MKKIQKIIVIFTVMFSFAYAGSALNKEEPVVYLGNNEFIENSGFIYEAPIFLTVPCENVTEVCDVIFPNSYDLFDACMVANGC